MATPTHKGIALTLLDGQEYVIPALTLGQLDRLQDDIAKIKGRDPIFEPECRNSMVEVVLASLQRNYPTLDRDKLLDLMDPVLLGDAWQAVIGVSGLVERVRRLEAKT
jgi:hypothetical protein